jgi:hypothetical protein
MYLGAMKFFRYKTYYFLLRFFESLKLFTGFCIIALALSSKPSIAAEECWPIDFMEIELVELQPEKYKDIYSHGFDTSWTIKIFSKENKQTLLETETVYLTYNPTTSRLSPKTYAIKPASFEMIEKSPIFEAFKNSPSLVSQPPSSAFYEYSSDIEIKERLRTLQAKISEARLDLDTLKKPQFCVEKALFRYSMLGLVSDFILGRGATESFLRNAEKSLPRASGKVNNWNFDLPVDECAYFDFFKRQIGFLKYDFHKLILCSLDKIAYVKR